MTASESRTVTAHEIFNMNMEYLFCDWDIQAVMSLFITVCAVILAAIFVKESLPYVIENIQSLCYCMKTFGVFSGINFYMTYGTEALPCADGFVTAVQYDMSDGDCDLIELVELVKMDASDGDTYIDDVVENLSKCYKKSSPELQKVIEVLKSGEKVDNNIIAKLNESTQVVFRFDIGENAHAIGKAYPTAVNHLNIELQKWIVETQKYKKKLDFHIILDETGKVIDILTTGRWN